MRFAFPEFSQRRGFSLVEVLTALLIFSLAVVAFLRSMGESTSIQSDLISRARAAALAQNVMEEIRLAGDFSETDETGEFEDEDAAFTWSSSVEETDIQSLKQVTVTISWNDGGIARDFRLTTLMADQTKL